MRWLDIEDIVELLEENHPEVDIMKLRFTELHKFVIELPGFSDSADRSNEKILEVIQAEWLELRG